MHSIQPIHDQYLNYNYTFKGLTKASIKHRGITMKTFLKFAPVEFIEQITLERIEDWVTFCKMSKDLKPHTIRTYITVMSLFLDWCVEKQFLPENPIKKMPKPKLPVRIPEHLTQEKAQAVIDWTKHYPWGYAFNRSRAVAMIAMFIFTGIRKSELRELKVGDVDLGNRVLAVRGGKGNKDRLIPISFSLYPLLEDYLKDRTRLKKTCPYFFTSLRANDRIGEVVVRRLISTIREKSGIYFRPHLLRHTFAVLMLEGGCDIYSLSKMMGHTSIKTTTIYLSATTTLLTEQMKKHPLNFI